MLVHGGSTVYSTTASDLESAGKIVDLVSAHCIATQGHVPHSDVLHDLCSTAASELVVYDENTRYKGRPMGKDRSYYRVGLVSSETVVSERSRMLSRVYKMLWDPRGRWL